MGIILFFKKLLIFAMGISIFSISLKSRATHFYSLSKNVCFILYVMIFVFVFTFGFVVLVLSLDSSLMMHKMGVI